MSHKYSVGQLCVIVQAESCPELIGRQCTILQIGCRGWVTQDNRDVSDHDYIVDVQGEEKACSCMEQAIRPVKPGDMPDFEEEETELDEEMEA